NECCGSYETVHNPDQVASMVYNIIEGARKNGAEVLVTSCPLCHFNLDRRQQILIEATPDFQPMPILYFTELMEMALIEERPQWTNHTVSVDEILDRFYK
ncbi:heterodisulfide reductase, subunit B, partial [bacterium]|nr:heterodisulfide reductase, subunit B [bacterium]